MIFYLHQSEENNHNNHIYLYFQFESQQECEAICVELDTEISRFLIDKCEQRIKEGPCAGNFSRYVVY